jgi:hypothetical protein
VTGEIVMPLIKGKVKFANITRPDDYDKYSIMVQISEEQYNEFKRVGVESIREDEETGEFWLSTKTNAVDDSGNRKKPPKVVDAKKNPLHGVDIGNGSTCVVQYTVKDYTWKKKKGVTTYLQAIQVLDLVPAFDDEFEVEEGGFDSTLDGGADLDVNDSALG